MHQVTQLDGVIADAISDLAKLSPQRITDRREAGAQRSDQPEDEFGLILDPLVDAVCPGHRR